MSKKIIQLDAYDEVEIWAAGLLQMRLKFEDGKLTNLVSGPMALAATKPGIIKALEEEGLSEVFENNIAFRRLQEDVQFICDPIPCPIDDLRTESSDEQNS